METAPALAAASADHDAALCPFVVQAWARLLQVAPTLLATVEAELKQAGLPPTQWYDALAALERQPQQSLSPGEIEQQLLLTQCTTSRLIDRLVAEGYALRMVNPDDRRRQTVHLSPAGQALIARMWPVYAAAIKRHVGRKLAPDDAQVLIRILEKLA
ncbi:MarR family winged helix-turn-helix transcriptional regulator [Dongia rigui]|uniref:MarR family winged helix-turn-helix transcriptional regulator n=1 Tax=Dongia rigui TaxID=940149 RepID=A0ABU5DX99_9PROT|nr:MarR family winged helix-turn-helix transcriptional regulator [Dongia rigui]MDY0871937.1 MarR family winged helix-turn-helix transcriptional regulator [Dongia rigui]